jgi:large subunit ribosomal protein L9
MEVILKQPVKNLGDQDDVVKVKPGYARNYLIPQGLAMLATESAKRALEEKKRQAEHKQSYLQAQAQEIADKLADTKIEIETLAGADGKLFGSVTSIQIVNKLKEQGFEIERKQITLDDIRETGEYEALIHLHKAVKARVAVIVTRREDA